MSTIQTETKKKNERVIESIIVDGEVHEVRDRTPQVRPSDAIPMPVGWDLTKANTKLAREQLGAVKAPAFKIDADGVRPLVTIAEIQHDLEVLADQDSVTLAEYNKPEAVKERRNKALQTKRKHAFRQVEVAGLSVLATVFYLGKTLAHMCKTLFDEVVERCRS